MKKRKKSNLTEISEAPQNPRNSLLMRRVAE